MIVRLAIAGALIGAMVAGAQTYRLNKLRQQVAISDVQIRACGARLQNLVEDLKSDNEIDQLPDGALTVVPDHWLRPERAD